MVVRLVESLSTSPAMGAVFSDESILGAMLAFEVGLARAEASVGIIPMSAVAAIESAARVELYDAGKIAADSLQSGTVTIPFVKALGERVRKVDAAAAGFVHWGATSQDVADTAMILLLNQAQDILRGDMVRLTGALHRLSEENAGVVMVSRTVLQAALPTTFGLKVAGWLGAVQRNRARLDSAFEEALILQFGGAAGTLASLGDKGIAVGQALARELSLPYPDAPWHAHRDRLANLMCDFGVMVGSLGKMARDISLLMQNEVAEVAEPVAKGRGGSSAMPHKQNPVGCTVTMAGAYRVPGLVSSFLSSMMQEHERAAGGWQSEWATISAIVQETGLAVRSMAEVAEGLTVDAEAMRANLNDTRGVIFAERATVLLAEKVGRDRASELVNKAVEASLSNQRNFVELLAAMPEVTAVLDAQAVRDLESPVGYLGVAEQFRRHLTTGQRDSGVGQGDSGAAGKEGRHS